MNRWLVMIPLSLFTFTIDGEVAINSDFTSNLYNRFRGLERKFTVYQMNTQIWEVKKDGTRKAMNELETVVDGTKRWFRVVHCSNQLNSFKLAKLYDERDNSIMLNDKLNVSYRFKLREAVIRDLPAPKPTTLSLATHIQKMFLCTPDSRLNLNDPVGLLGSDGKNYRCMWQDLLLPEALLRPGWHLASSSRDFIDPSLFGMSRSIGPGFSDHIWLNPQKGFALVERELRFQNGHFARYTYENHINLGGDLWFPLSCSWTINGKIYQESVASFNFGPVPQTYFDIDFKPGTKVIDYRSKSSYFIDGGEDLLAQMLDRIRVLYLPPATNQLWFFLKFSIISLLCLAILLFFLKFFPRRFLVVKNGGSD